MAECSFIPEGDSMATQKKRSHANRVWHGMQGRTNSLSPKTLQLLHDIETHPHRNKINAGALFEALYAVPEGNVLADKSRARIKAMLVMRQILNCIDIEFKLQKPSG